MPDPHDTLIVFAEVSVALAGFSGIVIAFERRSHGALTPLEKRRLSNMFTFSGLVLITFLLGVSLLNWERMDVETIWRGGSGLMFMIGVPWLVLDWRKVARLVPAEREQIKGVVIYPFTVAAVITLLLQVVNAVKLAQAWPFFLVLVLAIAFQQFILLVQMGLRDA